MEPAAELHWRVVPLRLEACRDDPYAKQPKPAHGPDAIMRERRAGLRAMAQRAGEPFELTALSLGHVCLLHLPGECLIEFQHYAQRSAPGRFVAVAAYGDLAPGYICPQRAFAEGGYEPGASRVAPDTEQRLKAAIRALLDLPADRGN